ncbi:MAG TPA: MgtC/SapB family protein [Acidimicrobiales bacterium]|nr:MgtC/SapB family protein [Acidimicrobiales bacterium]
MSLVGTIEPAVGLGGLLARLGVALVLGGLVGFEREVSQQPAGLRTHITVALGAALFGFLSVHGFDAYVQPRADSNYQIDVTRVASQVVVGVGFLGAGAILKEGATVRGLTTAASLWATAAIGLAVGVGSFIAATATTTALLVSLVGLRAPRRWVTQRLARGRGSVAIVLVEGGDLGATIDALNELESVTVRGLSVRRSDGSFQVEADLVGPPGVALVDLLAPLAERGDVARLDVN